MPIYSLSSWSSIISLKAAMFVDPIRDIYEVGPYPYMFEMTPTLSGFYNLHILSTPYQLYRRRKSVDHFDAWSRTGPPSMAPESLPSQSRYLRSSYFSGAETWNFAIRLVETNTRPGIDHHESHRHLPGGVPWSELWIPVERHYLQYQCDCQSLLSRNVLGLHVQGSTAFSSGT